MSPESDERLETVSQGLITPTWEFKLFPKITSPVVVLDGFLESNTHLFTLIGVFSALTIYFETTIQSVDGFDYLNNVIFTGFSLVTLLSLIVFSKAIIEIYKSERGWRSFGNVGLYLFLFFYSQIAVQFAGILLQFETILNTYIFIITLLTAETVGVFAGMLTILIPSLIANLISYYEKIVFTSLFTLILYFSFPVVLNLENHQLDVPDMSTLAPFSELVEIFISLVISFYVLILAGSTLIVYLLSAYWVLQFSWGQVKRMFSSV